MLPSRLRQRCPRPDLIVTFVKTVLNRTKQGAFRSALDASLTVLFRERYLRFLNRWSDDGLIIRRIQGMPMVLSTTDIGATPALLMLDRREPVATETYRESLQRLADETDGEITVLDVGANIGYYTLLTSEIFGDDTEILAFEPDPRNIKVLKANIGLHGLEERVSVEQVAVGDENDTVELALSSWNPGLNQVPLDDIPDSQRTKFDDRIEVESHTIDSILEERDVDGGAVDVVRIDVEGYEQRVLRGMQSLLDAGRPKLLFVEVHEPQLREGGEFDTLISLLDNYEFKILSASDGNDPLRLDSVRDMSTIKNGPIRLILAR